MERYQQEIKQEAQGRSIAELFHFTPIGNLRSILFNGLASRNVLHENGIAFLSTDRLRLDGHLDGISVSIHSINESMFAAMRREYRYEWVIFGLRASILWTHPCRFCWSNAATKEIRNHSGSIGGPWAFRKMFDDRPVSLTDERSLRSVCLRGDFEPTDNAAEVQVLNSIHPDLILGVIVRNQEVKAELEDLIREIDRFRPVFVNEEAFR